jgi:hypothetical protein
MKNLLLSLFIIFCLSCDAQKPFAPAGSQWSYEIRYAGYPPYIKGLYGLRAIKDTLIGTDTFSNINNEFLITSSDSFDYYLYRNEKKRLFKTTCRIGDTVTIDAYFKQITPHESDTVIPLQIVIDDIHPLTDNPINVYKFSLLEPHSIVLPYHTHTRQSSYIQHIGQSGDFSNFTGLFSPGRTIELRCFNSSAYNYKQADFTRSCDFSNVGINGLGTNLNLSLTISPNPVNIDANFYFKDGVIKHIILYDTKGKLIAEYKTSGKGHYESIDISALRCDVYQCVIETNLGKTVLPLYKD